MELFHFSVFEILLGVSEGKSFKDAFTEILPERIQRVSKAKTDNETEISERKESDENTD